MSQEKNDTHHLLYPRRDWNCHDLTKAMRSHWYLKVEIPTDTLHSEIHRIVKEIPVPSCRLLSDARRQLDLIYSFGAISNSDPIERRLTLLYSLFECSAPDTAEALKAELQVVLDNKKTSLS